MNLKEISDEEILMNICDDEEKYKSLLVEKYKNILDIMYIKYKNFFIKYKIDKEEVYAEALYAFSDAINQYNDKKDASFPTFLTVCIKRKYIKLIRKYVSEKNKFINSIYSLDYLYKSDDASLSLLDVLSNDKNDPLLLTIESETISYLNAKIKEELSEFEYEVFEYMLDRLNYNEIAILLDKNAKQIDNAMQRIRLKVKEIIEST